MNDMYKDKNVLIFGLGLNRGGLGSAKFFAKQVANVKVTDLKNADQLKISLDKLREFKNITYTLGEHKNEDIDWADLIIKNPAVKPGNKYLYYAQKKRKAVETDIGVFFQAVNRNQIIGVTGTKGKSTTASLIYEALKNSIRSRRSKPNNPRGSIDSNPGINNVILAGNIGASVLDAIPLIKEETFVVLEISSFQMEGLIKHQISPKYAVITNIYPDHLNYHPSMNSYVETKRMISFYQKEGDFLFLNGDDSTLNNPGFIKGLKRKIIFYSAIDLPDTFKPSLPGSHNRQNYAAALAVCKALEIPEVDALKAMNKFKGVQFRLETLKKWNGITIINDSAATTPDAAVQALKTYPNSILITGGMNKGLSYEKLAWAIDQNAKAVYFLEGDVVDDIICNMHEKPIIEGRFKNLEELLLKVKKDITSNPYFKKGDVIIFSPGATSFNLFQNEFDRGRKFNKAVEKIFQ